MNYVLNQDKKITPKVWILALLSLYGVWQIGVMFFSGTTLSLYGKTPINIDATYTTIFIVCGYLATIFLNYFFFNKSLLFGKIALIFSLILTLLMFLPFGTNCLTIIFYLNAFSCTFLIGINYAIETNLLDNKSELKFVFICSIIVFSSIVLMQGDFLNIPFFVFNIISALILIALIITYYLLPSTIDTLEKKKVQKPAKIPVILKIGIYLAIFVSTMCFVFGSAIAETVTNGVGIFYSIGILCSLLFGYLVFKKKVSPFKIFTFTFAPTIVGFVLAILSSQFAWCVYPAIILIGASCLPANMIGFLSNTLFKASPSKFYAPILVCIGLVVAVLQSVLLDLFRNNLIILFAVISVIAIIMLILYVAIESNLTYNWKNITLTESKNQGNVFDALSEREREVVDCILQGYNNTEMSKIVSLSPHTIKSYRKNIYAKLEIHTRSELFNLANKNQD